MTPEPFPTRQSAEEHVKAIWPKARVKRLSTHSLWHANGEDVAELWFVKKTGEWLLLCEEPGYKEARKQRLREARDRNNSVIPMPAWFRASYGCSPLTGK